MSLPTEGEEFAKLIEHLRKAQECCAMLANLAGMNSRPKIQVGWITVEEFMKMIQTKVTSLAQSRMQ